MIDKKGLTSDIEVKISKSDLWNGEAKKGKHQAYAEDNPRYLIPNFFYVCVPTALVEEAKKWVAATNPKYGVIEFITADYPVKIRGYRFWEHLLFTRKKAKPLHERVIPKWNTVLMRRLSSAVTMMHQLRITHTE